VSFLYLIDSFMMLHSSSVAVNRRHRDIWLSTSRVDNCCKVWKTCSNAMSGGA
jgi:hypothetical protein